MADDAPPLLHGSREESGDIDEGDNWDVEDITGANEACGLDRGVNVEAPSQHLGLIGNYANRLAVEAGKADDDVFGVAREQFEESALVHHLFDYPTHVVRTVRVRGYNLVQALALPVPLIIAGNSVRFCEGMVRQVG